MLIIDKGKTSLKISVENRNHKKCYNKVAKESKRILEIKNTVTEIKTPKVLVNTSRY